MSETFFATINNDALPIACTCYACQAIANGTNHGAAPVDGTTYAPTVTATPTQFADYLINGFWTDTGSNARKWADNTTITFSISNSYSTAQKDGFRMAFDQWADVADLTFSEVASGGKINIITNNTGQAWSGNNYGYAGNPIILTQNTISIDKSPWYWQNFDQLGDYAMLTAIHEIGHSLGLGHTGNYNGSATYSANAQFVNDSRQYSVMSYFDANNTGSNHQGEYSSTPMIYDILAMQTIYGANSSTRTGDTTYGFHSDAGRDQFDFTINIRPVVAIWDAGGTDLIDLSGWSMTQMINLNDGTFSNVGGGTGNLSIAIGADIENAIGGTGIDTIYGNELNNVINANSGNDIIYGSTGNDTINGASGTDQVIYSYDLSALTVSIVNSTTLTVRHNSLNFTDTLSNIETFTFNASSYSFAQLQSLLNVSSVAMTFGGSGWSSKQYNSQGGSFAFTSGNLGQGGSTSYVSGTRADDTTLSLANLNTAVLSTYISNQTLTDVAVSDFRTVDLYTTNATGVTVAVDSVQSGKTTTGNGDDTITIDLHLYDAGVLVNYRILSGAGADTITVSGDNASLFTNISAGDGNDIITIASNISNKVSGEAGDDTINGNIGNDDLRGDAGNDLIYGNDGDDYIAGGAGNDELHGGVGNDKIYGGNNDDLIYGDFGDDTLFGDLGNDTIYGGDGNDYINGDDNDDTIYGGNGNDQLYGSAGNDTIFGDAGIDKIVGGYGDDILIGIGDGDSIYGQAGADTFALTDYNGGRDRYFDFNLTQGDTINITDVLSGYTHGVDDINDFVYFRDRGSYTDMMISRNGDGNFYQAASIWDSNTLDGLTVNALIAANDLIVNQTVL